MSSTVHVVTQEKSSNKIVSSPSIPSIPRYIKKEKKIEAGEKMNFQEQNNIPCINTKPTL